VTKTISTATITAQQVAAASDEATRTVLTQVGSKDTLCRMFSLAIHIIYLMGFSLDKISICQVDVAN
jgi:hypothetical protein